MDIAEAAEFRDIFWKFDSQCFQRNIIVLRATPSGSGSGSFEVLMLDLTIGNGSGTDFGTSQCIPVGPFH